MAELMVNWFTTLSSRCDPYRSDRGNDPNLRIREAAGACGTTRHTGFTRQNLELTLALPLQRRASVSIRAWILAMVLVSAGGCGSRGSERQTEPDATNGETTSDDDAAGGLPSSGGGMPGTGGGIAGSGGEVSRAGTPAYTPGTTGGCVEQNTGCIAAVTIPFVSLPDGTLGACIDDHCVEQSVASGHVSASSASGPVEVIDGKIRATWRASRLGLWEPTGCTGTTGNRVTFRSLGGTDVALFSGGIPMVTSYGSCTNVAKGSVTLAEAVDIAALLAAREADGSSGGMGGAASTGGAGGQAAGSSGRP